MSLMSTISWWRSWDIDTMVARRSAPGPQAAEQLFVHRRNASRSIGQARARQILTDALENESHTVLDLAAVHRLTASVEKQRRRRVGLEVLARDLSARGCGRFAPRPRA